MDWVEPGSRVKVRIIERGGGELVRLPILVDWLGNLVGGPRK